jgi:guanylate kinase
VHVFVLPPSSTPSRQRLRARGTETTRSSAAGWTRRRSSSWLRRRYDYVLVNDDLEASHAAFQGILLAETSRRVGVRP